jgi:Ras association domain-containing protein 1
MDYNPAQKTRTVYQTADGGWKQESYCVVQRVEHQHRRNGSTASENNIVTSTVRERFQQSRNLGSDGHLERRQDLGGVSGWPKGSNDPGHEVKACGLLGNMQRKWSSQLGHYGNKLYDFAASNIFPREHGSQVRPRQNIGNDDFEVMERHELADLRDDLQPSNHGHRFAQVNLKDPNWCDKCGEFIWGMYKHCYICINCRYTCHLKCRQAVTLQCHVRADDKDKTDEETTETSFTSELDNDVELDEDDESGYYTCRSASHASFESSDSRSSLWTREKLMKRIESFNLNNHGLQMNMDLLDCRNTFQGFIRVHMNLIRPINVSISSNPPSHYSALTHEMENNSVDETTKVMSFYLPKNTSKVIHISSTTTAQEVIRALLSKFKITDNPRKFALYEKNLGNRKTGMTSQRCGGC